MDAQHFSQKESFSRCGSVDVVVEYSHWSPLQTDERNCTTRLCLCGDVEHDTDQTLLCKNRLHSTNSNSVIYLKAIPFSENEFETLASHEMSNILNISPLDE